MIQPGFSPFREKKRKKAVTDLLFQKCNKYLYYIIALSCLGFSFSLKSAVLPTPNGTKCSLKNIFMYTCTDALCVYKRQSSQEIFLSPILSQVLAEETITYFP